MSRRARVALVAGVGLGVLWLEAGPLWRALYPVLPRGVQAVPYRLQAYLPGPRPTPVALPTPPPIATGSSPSVRGGPTSSGAPETGARVSGGQAAATRITVPTSSPSPAAMRAPTGSLPATATSPPPASAHLGGLRHEYQTWNNCGPATVSMALSLFGSQGGQADAARRLKPDPDDKNVGPDELARYAAEQGFVARVRVNGDEDLLRRLLALGVPVIVETWFIPEPGDEMGHYRVLTGYDDAAGAFDAADSYNGPAIRLPYASLDALWRVFNRTYVVIYPPQRAGEVEALLGDRLDDQAMYAAAAARAQAEIAAREDAYGWFNLGSSLVGIGDRAGAVGAYDRARGLGLPWRMLWYQFGPFEAYAAAGRWDDVIALADANLRNAPNLEESHYWRGRAMDARGDTDGARAAWRRAVDLNPLYPAPREALASPGP